MFRYSIRLLVFERILFFPASLNPPHRKNKQTNRAFENRFRIRHLTLLFNARCQKMSSNRKKIRQSAQFLKNENQLRDADDGGTTVRLLS